MVYNAWAERVRRDNTKYFVDQLGRRQGKFIGYYGIVRLCFCGNDTKIITENIVEIVDDIYNISSEEQLVINLKFGIKCLEKKPPSH